MQIAGDRINEIVVKTCNFSYLTQSPDAANIYAVGSDKTVKHIAQSRIVQEIDLHSFVLSSICLSNNGATLVSGRASNEGYPKVCEDFTWRRPLLGPSPG